MLKRFSYKKKDGTSSDRVVFITSPASDCDMGIDLSEFSEEEIAFYVAELEDIKKMYDDNIKLLGLWHNWRKFKVDGISALHE